jgi:hypothetical protein
MKKEFHENWVTSQCSIGRAGTVPPIGAAGERLEAIEIGVENGKAEGR